MYMYIYIYVYICICSWIWIVFMKILSFNASFLECSRKGKLNVSFLSGPALFWHSVYLPGLFSEPIQPIEN